MHYRRGIDSLYDLMWGKMLRIRSLLESGETPKNEALEDSFKDLINYGSFAVSWLRGCMEGQDSTNDIFNNPKLTGPNTEKFLYVPDGDVIPYDSTGEQVNFTATFNERYIGNQASGNVF